MCCKVTVRIPAVKVSVESGTLTVTESGGKKIINMRKGENGIVEVVLTPEFSTDLSKVKISASGGIAIKNGIIYANKAKNGKITVKCGKKKEVVTVKVTK